MKTNICINNKNKNQNNDYNSHNKQRLSEFALMGGICMSYGFNIESDVIWGNGLLNRATAAGRSKRTVFAASITRMPRRTLNKIIMSIIYDLWRS